MSKTYETGSYTLVTYYDETQAEVYYQGRLVTEQGEIAYVYKRLHDQLLDLGGVVTLLERLSREKLSE